MTPTSLRTPPMEFAYDRGIHLAGSVLWFDARRADVLSFVSSARVESAWRCARALCTDRTRALVRAGSPGFQALVVPFGRRLALGPLSLTLQPAGCMPGSAQVLVEDGSRSALYASNLCLEPHELAEPFVATTADTLVLEAVYGLPSFVFPPRAEALATLVERARRAVSDGLSPVFLCSPVGKAQEVTRALSGAGFPVAVHRSIAAVDRAYRALGFDPGHATTFRGSLRPGTALVHPDRLRAAPSIQKLQRARLFWVSGRATMPDVLARMRVDEGIPLAGHLDHPSLLRFIEGTRARRVYTVGYWAEAFAEGLRGRGLEATSLYREVQLSLF